MRLLRRRRNLDTGGAFMADGPTARSTRTSRRGGWPKKRLYSRGTYGTHLKAIVEAFKDAARLELMGPMYLMEEGGKSREVPKMAFRVEITDEFRLDELATEIYRDLIRYGIFMRDARGKSVRGAMVPEVVSETATAPLLCPCAFKAG